MSVPTTLVIRVLPCGALTASRVRELAALADPQVARALEATEVSDFPIIRGDQSPSTQCARRGVKCRGAHRPAYTLCERSAPATKVF